MKNARFAKATKSLLSFKAFHPKRSRLSYAAEAIFSAQMAWKKKAKGNSGEAAAALADLAEARDILMAAIKSESRTTKELMRIRLKEDERLKSVARKLASRYRLYPDQLAMVEAVLLTHREIEGQPLSVILGVPAIACYLKKLQQEAKDRPAKLRAERLLKHTLPKKSA